RDSDAPHRVQRDQIGDPHPAQTQKAAQAEQVEAKEVGIEERLRDQALLEHSVREPEPEDGRPAAAGTPGYFSDQPRATAVQERFQQEEGQEARGASEDVERGAPGQHFTHQRRQEEEDGTGQEATPPRQWPYG